MKRILGLDASSSTIGICLLSYDDFNIKLEYLDYFKPKKSEPIFEKLSSVRKYIQNKIEELKPDDVVLEDIVLFMKNKSSAKTISTLAILNRTVGLAVFDKTGEPPHLYNVLTIRHKIKIGKSLPAKEEIPELVASILKIDFPYILNKKGKIKAETYDQADSVACALSFIFKNREVANKNKKKRGKRHKS